MLNGKQERQALGTHYVLLITIIASASALAIMGFVTNSYGQDHLEVYEKLVEFQQNHLDAGNKQYLIWHCKIADETWPEWKSQELIRQGRNIFVETLAGEPKQTADTLRKHFIWPILNLAMSFGGEHGRGIVFSMYIKACKDHGLLE